MMSNLNFRELLEAAEYLKVPFVGFTVHPSMYYRIRSACEPTASEFGAIFFTEIYQVFSQTAPIIKWSDRNALRSFLAVHEPQEKDLEERLAKMTPSPQAIEAFEALREG